MNNYKEIKSALIIQYNYRNKILKKNDIITQTKNLRENIFDIINQTNLNYEKELISSEKLNIINDKISSIIKKLSYIDLDSTDLFHNKAYICIIIEEINNLLKLTNFSSLLNLFNFLNYQNSDLIEKYNLIFKPIELNLFKKTINKYYFYDSDEDDNSIIKLSYVMLKIPLYKNKYIDIKGYFLNDNLNFFCEEPFIKNKIISIKKELNFSNIPILFITRYLKQLSLKSLILNDESNIIEEINLDYQELINLSNLNISSLVKHFVSSNMYKQRNIIILLLLSDKKETNHLSNLLFSLISNDSELLKQQPGYNTLYNSLHRSVQILLENNFKEKDKEKRENLFKALTVENISYEKRISILKCNDLVKKKASEKLKELKSNKDNSSKAQQYLDTLLKVPFGIYKKEYLFSYLNDYLEKFKKYMLEIKKIIPAPNLDDEESIDAIEKIKILVNKFNINECNTENYVVSFLKNMEITVMELKNKKLEDDIKFVNNKFKTLIDNWKNLKKEKKEYMENVRSIMDKCTYAQNEAKNTIERLVAQWINGSMEGAVLGICGPPGVGKTTLIKYGLSKCLYDKNNNCRPFFFIGLGGSTNGSTFEGHGYTYVNSQCGRIVEILTESNCMNPIIFIDELDKVSNTENGKEIIGILTHLTDPTQNNEFSDRYFSGIKFDLSKVLFVFSYNDPEKIDRILKDRITEIKVEALKKTEKLEITKNYILPEVLKSVGYNKNDIVIEDDCIDFIIENYTFEAGVRKLKEKLYEVIREINLNYILETNDIIFPFKVNIEYVQKVFNNKPTIKLQSIAKKPLVGVVNGLYATQAGTGGLTIIEVMNIPSEKTLSLELTGQQGDVMKESMKCAKTVVWNILPEDLKKNIFENYNKSYSGLHIHCPEGGTPKDGPSAGIAICTAIVSKLCNIKIKNDVAMTGEISLREGGKVLKIGGLSAKLLGAKKAGVKTVIIPEDNQEDYEKIDQIEDLNVIPVSHLKQVLEIALEKNNIEFIF
jgi:endopeptidase La